MHYYRILFLHEMVGLARLNEEALSEIKTLIEARAEVGEVRELEAIRLRVEHMRARNELEAMELELDQFRRHLNTFLGNVLPAGFEIEGSLEVGHPDPDLDELISTVLPFHPDLVKAGMQREAAQKSSPGPRERSWTGKCSLWGLGSGFLSGTSPGRLPRKLVRERA
jgi:outer membrane protein TolC